MSESIQAAREKAWQEVAPSWTEDGLEVTAALPAFNEGFDAGVKVADEQTADLRNRLEAYEWRLVEVELPIKNGLFLVTATDDYENALVTRLAYRADSGSWYYNHLPVNGVIAWMPLPDPFKELQEATK